MKLKFLVLLVVCALFAFKSQAQLFFTVSGQISNTNFVTVAIAIEHSDSMGFPMVDSTNTDTGGFFTFTLFLNSFDSIKCSYNNCIGVVTDTIFPPFGSIQAIWNSDYCPPIPPPDSCTVIFTSNYCTCNDTFFLELDTSGLGTKTLLWNFGDGNSSTQTFPYHVFSSHNLFDVCLNVISSTNQDTVCSFCHQIGFDNNGNVVTRTEGSGLIIKVIAPGTKIIDEVLSNSISVFPNPSGDNASVNFYTDEENIYELKIFNLIGQQVKSFSEKAVKGNNTYHFNLNELAAGNYFITVRSGGKRLTTVFAK